MRSKEYQKHTYVSQTKVIVVFEG